MAGTEMAGTEMAGTEMAGTEMAGEMMAGEMMAGEMMAGEMMAGEMMAGEMMAGDSNGLLCGDGIVGLGEGCDDGNQYNDDGCSSACQIEDMSCIDDALEPNDDTSPSIQQIMPGQAIEQYMLCLSDRDYFALQGCVGGQLEVIVNFDVNAMDIDLRLTDESGRLLDSSALAGEVERVSHYFTADETVYLEVAGYLDTAEGPYSITTLLNGCMDSPADECMANIDCPNGEQCIQGQCSSPPQGCTADTECLPSETCVGGQCVMMTTRCDFDFDCPLGEICEDGQCILGIGTDCTFNFDCDLNQTCQGGVCIDPPVLTDDRFEENDDQSTATVLEPGAYIDLVIVSDDDDYFAVEVCAAGTIEANISFSNLVGDLELSIEDDLGVTLDSSEGTGSTESVSWTNRGSNTVTTYVNVYGFLGGSGAYNMSVIINGCGQIPIDELDEDMYEDNDTFQDASALLPGSYSDLTRTTNDDDWYVVDVCEGGTIDVDILFSHAQGDINAWLYDEAVLYLDGALTSSDNESLSGTVSSAQRVYINVFSFSGEAEYGLNISVTGCLTGLEPDRLEDNDSLETAERLMPNIYGDLTITEDDEDWIIFDVCEGGDITVNVNFTDTDGDIDAYLYDPSGSVLSRGTTSSDNEVLAHLNASAGQYAIRVYGYNGAQNTYDLSFTVSDCGPLGLMPDRLEENDTRETGELLTPNRYSNLNITEGDEDWILFDVCEGATITVDLYFTDADGDIDAYLYGPTDFTVDSSTTSSDNEQLTVDDATAGQYALKVYGFIGDENTYDLVFSVEGCDGGGDLSPDRLEENDTRETAELLTPNLYNNLNLIGDDEDWIAVDVCESGNLTVDVLFSHAEGDIDVGLSTSTGGYIDGSLSSTDNEQVGGTNLSGRVHIRIHGYGDDVSYDLRITMICP